MPSGVSTWSRTYFVYAAVRGELEESATLATMRPRIANPKLEYSYATPGAFQAWLEEALDQTRLLHSGDARLVFVNAWNEWAEGAYLEPDMRFGHTYLEAVRNALDAALLLRPRSGVVG